MPTPDIDITSDIEDGTLDNAPDVSTPSTPSTPAAAPVQEAPKTDAQSRPKADADSLRDQITSALRASPEDDTPGAAKLDGERPRGPDGRFAPAVDPLAPVEAPAASVVAPPPFLDPAQQQVFGQLPPELQTSVAGMFDTLADREARVTSLQQVEQLIAPRREAWALEGMTEGQALNQLLALSDFAGRDPAGFVQYFASQQGIDLEQLLYDNEPTDPAYSELEQRYNQLNARVQSFEQSQAQQQHNAIVNEVQSFALETNADGTRLRPYFEELGGAVMPYVQMAMQQNPNAPRTQILQEAYDRACWAEPAIRQKILDAQAAATAAATLRQQQERTAKAKEASTSVAPGVPNGNVTSDVPQNRTLREELRANLRAQLN